VQDNVRVTESLTANLGLRWEMMTNPSDVDGRIANYELVGGQLTSPLATDPVISKTVWTENRTIRSFAPRIGFAWNVAGKGTTSVRSGFGVFYHQPEDDHRRALGANPPFYVVLQKSNVTFPLDSNALLDAGGQTRPTAMVRDADVPTLLQYNVRIEQSLGQNMRVGAGYVGSHGYHQNRLTDPQVAIPQLQDGRLVFPRGTVRKNLALANSGVGLIVYDGNSFYDSLQVDLERRLAGGLQFKFAYTWSKSIDDSSGTLALTGVNTTDNFPQDHKANRGPSSFDVTHNLAANWTYELPLARLFAPNAATEGWQVSGVLTLQSGQPFEVDTGISGRLGGGTLATGRPDLKPGLTRDDIILGTPQASPRYFDPTAFLLPAVGVVGNVGRNSLRGPGVATVDASVQKMVPLGATKRLQLRLEGFNVLNRPNFRFPAVRSIFDATGRIVPSAGVITETSTTSRQLQVSAKFIF
jgi:hypothetical protein